MKLPLLAGIIAVAIAGIVTTTASAQSTEERIEKYAPTFADMQRDLPNMVHDGRPELHRAYWGAWWWMDVNTDHRPGIDNIEPHYISAAYGGNAFSWDTSTMILFARYGWKTRPTIVAMNNFYRNPIRGRDDDEFILPHEILGLKKPSGIPPQILSWAEWEHYLTTADKDRLRYALPFLVKNFDSLKTHRLSRTRGSKQAMAYRRIGKGVELHIGGKLAPNGQEGHPLGSAPDIAVDTVAQMAHSALCIWRMAEAIDDEALADRMRAEYEAHAKILQDRHWDDQRKFFLGTANGDALFPFFQASNFWPWLAEATTPEQDIEMLVALFDPTRYRQGNFVPTTSFENVRWFAYKDARIHGQVQAWYSGHGSFWQGGAWPPTNQMIIRGLRNSGYPMLSREVAMDVLTWSIEHPLKGDFDDTPLEKTDFRRINVYAEHFNPDFERRYNKHRKTTSFRLTQSGVKSGRFVGWSGGPVLNGIIEELIGILPDAPAMTVTWRIEELDRHGLTNLTLADATIDLICQARASADEPIELKITTDKPFTLQVVLGNHETSKRFEPGEHTWSPGTYVDPMADLEMTAADFSATGEGADPRWTIGGIRLGMSMDEVKKLAGESRWFNKPLTLLGHHYADRMTVFPEGKTYINVIFNADGKVIMAWQPYAPGGDPDERLKSLTEKFGKPATEWRHPDYGHHQSIVWGDARTDAFGLPANGTEKPSLLMYNIGKGNITTRRKGNRIGGMLLWDPVGIDKMRSGLRKLITHAVEVAQPDE